MLYRASLQLLRKGDTMLQIRRHPWHVRLPVLLVGRRTIRPKYLVVQIVHLDTWYASVA